MKRTLALLCLLLAAACAQAAFASSGAALPQQIADWLTERGYSSPQGHLLFDMPDGTRQAFVITDGGWGLYGFVCQDGEWTNQSSGGAMEGYADISLRRHTAQQLRPDGTAYGDALGFDIMSDSGAYLSYHYDGAFFTVCGWYDPARYDGKVMVRGTVLEYYPAGSAAPEAAVDAEDPLRLHGWCSDFERHPATPAEAMALAAVSESAIVDAFPGYELNSYSDFGGAPEASYLKVENGCLHIKRTSWKAGSGLLSEIDSMPLPLSPGLLERLRTEPADSLIDASGFGDTFLTEDAFDTSLVPVTDTVVQNDLQQHGLILLTEDAAGARRVQVVCRDEDGRYFVDVTTPPLPAGAFLDLFHEGDGDLQIGWGSPDREGYMCYSRGADGVWRLTYGDHRVEEAHVSFAAVYYGITMQQADGEDRMCVGSVKMGTLDKADPLALPRSTEEVASLIDRTGWAVVSNPDPADRLHLRTEPDRGAESLGKFYNGTPVQVLSQKGEWSEVSVGLDGLRGWMMTKYLAFGEAMDAVKTAFPQLTHREEYHAARPAYDSKACKNIIQMDERYHVAGVVEDELYILLTDLGQTGYAPQEWLYEGNG